MPEYIKSTIPQKRKSNSTTVVSHSESDMEPVDSVSVQSIPQSSIDRWIDRTDAALMDELNEAFSKMIYSSGVPFVFADHPNVKKFLQLVKPSWNPPSAKVIAGTLLAKHCKAINLLKKFY